MKVAQVWQEVSGKLASEGIEDALLESELLLRQTLEVERSEFYSGLGGELTNFELTKLNELLTQRLTHKPSAYIRHVKEFYGLEFTVDERVLIPRPETELLVEKALEVVKHMSPHPSPLPGGERGLHYSSLLSEADSARRRVGEDKDEGESSLLIADIGAGSGAIAVALAVNLPQASIYATDISEQALEVAEINCKKHGVTKRVQLLSGDLLAPLSQPVDIIIANLPYVPDREMLNLAPEVRQFEPTLALSGGCDGLDYIRRLLAQVSGALRPDGALLLEVGMGQAEVVAEMVHHSFPEVNIATDLAGIGRVVVGRL